MSKINSGVRELYNEIDQLGAKYGLNDGAAVERLVKKFTIPNNMDLRATNREYQDACEKEDKSHIDAQVYQAIDQLVQSYLAGNSVSGVHLYRTLVKAKVFNKKSTASENIDRAVGAIESVVFLKAKDKQKFLDVARTLLEECRGYLENNYILSFYEADNHLKAMKEYIDTYSLKPVKPKKKK